MLRVQIDLEQAQPVAESLDKLAAAYNAVPEGNAVYIFPDSNDAFNFTMRAAKIGFHLYVHNVDCCHAGEGCCQP
jgi:hypothetical protein